MEHQSPYYRSDAGGPPPSTSTNSHHSQSAAHHWLQPIQTGTNSPYASPTSALPSPSDASFANIFGSRSEPATAGPNNLGRNASSTTLSLNMSGLTVASPSTLSPHPGTAAGQQHPPSTAGSVSSPITPVTPQPHLPGGGMLAPQTASAMFRYTPPDTNGINPYEPSSTPQPNGGGLYAPPGSSRSSSSSDRNYGGEKAVQPTVPRKRPSGDNGGGPHSHENGGGMPLSLNVDGMGMFGNAHVHPPHTLHHFEDNELTYPQSSPMDESPSSTGFPDEGSQSNMTNMGGQNSSSGFSGTKAGTTNNFVSKLYTMICDPKAARFIVWTEHGTSFVVSNVGEFSRSILGTHFKHNNFSSFVRQLNMYGFSKINRTPRAQRANTDGQTWEFAHSKFLRGRPDLLDEIRRKALEPDPTIKQRVELPGELAAQLNYIQEENRRVVRALVEERDRNVRLANVVKTLWDVVSNRFGAEVPFPFPMDLLTPPPLHPSSIVQHADENPGIYVTSPINNASPNYATHSAAAHGMYHLSPQSSPTTTDFPHNTAHQSRGISLPHIATLQHHNHNHSHTHSHVHHPQHLQRDEPDYKRQRMSNNAATHPVTGRIQRARSDSAPLNQAQHPTINAWQAEGGRPRSGSGLLYHPGHAGVNLGVPNNGLVGLGIMSKDETS